MTKRTYTKGTMRVHWDADLCTHCGECIAGLPAVFNLNERPWVNLAGASAEEIRQQVGQCPSGALSITEMVE